MRILVTGTSGGIGGAVASAARSAGHEVAEVNRADWTKPEVCPGTPLDAVVFATGYCPVSGVTQLSDAELAETFQVNCGLFVRLMREIARRRLAAPGGLTALAVSSVSASEGWAGGVAYCASKGALSAACRALDAELAGRGMRVRVIEPRHVLTRMFRTCAGRMGVPDSAAQSPDALASEILNLVTTRENQS